GADPGRGARVRRDLLDAGGPRARVPRLLDRSGALVRRRRADRDGQRQRALGDPARLPPRPDDGCDLGRLLRVDRAADAPLLALPHLGARARDRLDPARGGELVAGLAAALVVLGDRLAPLRVRGRRTAVLD